MGSLLGVVRAAQKRHGAALLAVLNVTPDSFSDGALYEEADRARARVDELLAEGADIIDVGAESTRPGAHPVPAAEQIDRAGPVIAHAVERGALVSIDTTDPQVARAALELGARIINDVSCLTDSALAQIAVNFDADLIIMHSRGSMTQMAGFSAYDGQAYQDVVTDVAMEWSRAQARALAQGLARERIWFDPGLGFHKNAEHSTALLARLEEFSRLGSGIVAGPSRKSFLGALDGSSPQRRLGGTIAACLRAVDAGADILRIHDVHDVRQALLARQAFKHRHQEVRRGIA